MTRAKRGKRPYTKMVSWPEMLDDRVSSIGACEAIWMVRMRIDVGRYTSFVKYRKGTRQMNKMAVNGAGMAMTTMDPRTERIANND